MCFDIACISGTLVSRNKISSSQWRNLIAYVWGSTRVQLTTHHLQIMFLFQPIVHPALYSFLLPTLAATLGFYVVNALSYCKSVISARSTVYLPNIVVYRWWLPYFVFINFACLSIYLQLLRWIFQERVCMYGTYAMLKQNVLCLI